MSTTFNFINDKSEHYCLTEVEAGKAYKVCGQVDNRIYFRYLIMDTKHNKKIMVQAPVDIQNNNFEHIIRPIENGCLCIRSLKNTDDYWKNLTIEVEVMGYE